MRFNAIGKLLLSIHRLWSLNLAGHLLPGPHFIRVMHKGTICSTRMCRNAQHYERVLKPASGYKVTIPRSSRFNTCKHKAVQHCVKVSLVFVPSYVAKIRNPTNVTFSMPIKQKFTPKTVFLRNAISKKIRIFFHPFEKWIIAQRGKLRK